MKRIFIFILTIALVAFGYWFIFVKNKNSDLPQNPPTKEELQRMEEIEESSSKIAPDAVAGAGVRPVGSLPKPAPTQNAETESTTTEKTD